MDNIDERLKKLGVVAPEILLPREAALRQWAVIACDQFTQDRSLWKKIDEEAGPVSTLRLIYPEVFLAEGDGSAVDRSSRIEKIHKSMRDYLDAGVFAPPRRGFVYLERDTPFNRGRRGLVAAVDLERYSWSPQARPLIRTTEGTVPERLPPRMEVRRNAPIETQHVLLLIDDDTDTLLTGLAERAKKNAPAYSGDLMLNAGAVSGWFLDTDGDTSSNEAAAFLADKLDELAQRAISRYGAGNLNDEPFLFAVGDGNHSLASAKGVWDECKAAVGDFHPSRYALVEIENIYDPAIHFEPIHRLVFGLDFDRALRLLSALPGFSSRVISGREELAALVAEPVKGNRFGLISGDRCAGSAGRYALIQTSAVGLSTACLQPLLDEAISDDGGLSIDYIHGEDELFRLAANAGAVSGPGKPVTGILLPPVQKAGFFETVARCGPLPRKSFSMGEAEEKRFYIECRRLFE